MISSNSNRVKIINRKQTIQRKNTKRNDTARKQRLQVREFKRGYSYDY